MIADSYLIPRLSPPLFGLGFVYYHAYLMLFYGFSNFPILEKVI